MTPKRGYAGLSANQQRWKKIVLAVIVTGLICTNFWLLIEFLQKETKIVQQEQIISTNNTEREALNEELGLVKQEFETIRSENKGLAGRLNEKEAEIKAKVAQIEELIKHGDDSQLKVAKAELFNLRRMSARFIANIDSINHINKKLVAQNDTLSVSLKEVKTQNEQLLKENKALATKISVATALKVVNYKIEAVRIKESGKEVSVSRAEKVEKLKLCFTVVQNEMTDKGIKNMEIRLLGPFEDLDATENPKLNYVIKQPIAYNGTSTDYCFYWGKKDLLTEGYYVSELCIEGQLCTKTTFRLK